MFGPSKTGNVIRPKFEKMQSSDILKKHIFKHLNCLKPIILPKWPSLILLLEYSYLYPDQKGILESCKDLVQTLNIQVSKWRNNQLKNKTRNVAKLLLQNYLSVLILKCFQISKIHCVIACFVFRGSETMLVVGGLETL